MIQGSLYHRFRAILHLILIQSLVPLSLTYLFLQFLNKLVTRAIGTGGSLKSMSDDKEKRNYTVVLTGGKMSKTLHMARCLKNYSFENPNVSMKIVVLESKKFRYCATRFSRCVDHFETITSPRESAAAYMNGIYDACKRHGATHFLPVAAPVEAVFDAQVKERLEKDMDVSVLHMDHKLCEILDDKHAFGCFLRDQLKLRSPRTHQVTNNEEVHSFNENFRKETEEGKLKRKMILKNLAYDPIHRLDLFQLPTTKENLDAYLRKIEADGNPISKEEPWQLQEFLSGGVEYAAMIVVRSNHLVTMTCCPSSASQLNYVHSEIPPIREWLFSFMEGLKNSQFELTGQLCFDFMVVKENGKEVAYPIECNPRVHTQCTIYNRDDVRALFGSLLLNHTSNDEQELIELLDRDYGTQHGTNVNIFWFYNEFFKIFPNSWLLTYNESNDSTVRAKMAMQPMKLPSLRVLLVFILYLPSLYIMSHLAIPVFVCLALTWTEGRTNSDLGFFAHLKVMITKSIDFFERLSNLHENLEGDLWLKDPVPFFAKNHVQVPSRLLASLRTGVEWKKIDFAIGKVVEVGGD